MKEKGGGEHQVSYTTIGVDTSNGETGARFSPHFKMQSSSNRKCSPVFSLHLYTHDKNATPLYVP